MSNKRECINCTIDEMQKNGDMWECPTCESKFSDDSIKEWMSEPPCPYCGSYNVEWSDDGERSSCAVCYNEEDFNKYRDE